MSYFIELGNDFHITSDNPGWLWEIFPSYFFILKISRLFLWGKRKISIIIVGNLTTPYFCLGSLKCSHSKDWKIFNNQKVFQFIFHHHHLSHFPINNQLANFSPFSIKDLVKSIFLLLILRVCELREDPFLFVAECPNWDLVFFLLALDNLLLLMACPFNQYRKGAMDSISFVSFSIIIGGQCGKKGHLRIL